MARLLTCGFELGSIAAEETMQAFQNEGLTAVSAYSTTTVRSGRTSLQITGSGGYGAALINAGPSANTYYMRLAVNFAQFDAGGADQWLFLISDESTGFELTVHSDGTAEIQNYSDNSSVAVLSGAFALNRWYVLEASFSPSTGAAVVRVDGVQVASGTCETCTDTIDLSLTATTNPCSIFIDDWAINDSTGTAQNSWCGLGHVVVLLPVADSSTTGFTNGAGGTTNLWDAVDNTPPVAVIQTSATATSQIEDANNNATDNYQPTLQSYTAAGVPSGANIVLAQATGSIGNSTATSRNAGLSSVSNPAIAEAVAGTGTVKAGTWAASGWVGIIGPISYAPAVTLGTGPVLKFRKATASANVMMAAFLGLIAEWVPAAPTTTTTPVARLALASARTPATRTAHSLHVRARLQSSAAATIRMALYQGATNISGDLESSPLTTTLTEYTLPLTDLDAATITDYSSLEVRFWGFGASGATPVLEVADVWLVTPLGSAAVAQPILPTASATSAATASITAPGVLTPSAAVTATATAAMIVPNTQYETMILGEPGLISYWRLGDAAGAFADSEDSNPATATGGITRNLPGLIVNNLNGAASGDGAVGSYLNVPDTANLRPAVFTIECWAKPNSLADATLINKFPPWEIDMASSRWLAYLRPTTGSSQDIQIDTESAPVALKPKIGVAQHIAATFDATFTLRLYVNGTFIGSATTNAAALQSGTALSFFSDKVDPGFNGTLDEVAFYNTVLTPAQLLAHYAVGAGLPWVAPAASASTAATAAVFAPVVLTPTAAAVASASASATGGVTLTASSAAVTAASAQTTAVPQITPVAAAATAAAADVSAGTATRAAGFPVNLTSTNTGTVNPKKVGDLMIVAGRRSNNVVDVTAISGGGCTNWTKVVDRVDAADFVYAFLWVGTVTTIGSQTITLTVTDSPSSEITVDSFTASQPGGWQVDVSAANGAPASVPTMPSLTPTQAGSTPISELYYGWLFTNGSYTAGGSTPGFHYESVPFLDGPLVWNVGVVSGAQQPAISVGSGLWITVAAIFYLKAAVPQSLTASASATAAATGTVTAPSTLYRDLILSEPGLISYWRLDEASGSALDSKGSNHATTVAGGITRQAPGLLTNAGDAAVRGDGAVGTYLSAPYNASMDTGAQVTYECWVSIEVFNANAEILARGTAEPYLGETTSHGYEWYVRDINDTDTILDAFNVIVVGQRQHVVGTYDAAGSMKLYVNGVSVGTPNRSPNAAVRPLTEPFLMLADAATDPSMQGTLDEVAIYSVALTPTQVLKHYYTGLGTPLLTLAAQAAASAASLPTAMTAFVPVATGTTQATATVAIPPVPILDCV